MEVDDAAGGEERYRWRSAISAPAGPAVVLLSAVATVGLSLAWLNADPRAEAERANWALAVVVALAVLAASIWRVAVQGLEVTSTGIVVRNLSSTHRLRWSDISEIRPTAGRAREGHGQLVAPLVEIRVFYRDGRGDQEVLRIDCLTAKTLAAVYRRPAMAMLLRRAPSHVKRYRVGDDGSAVPQP